MRSEKPNDRTEGGGRFQATVCGLARKKDGGERKPTLRTDLRMAEKKLGGIEENGKEVRFVPSTFPLQHHDGPGSLSLPAQTLILLHMLTFFLN